MIRIQDWKNENLAAFVVFPRLTTDRYFEEPEYKKQIEELVQKGIGGFCVFTGSSESVQRMTEELQMLADIPLLFCADFEHGLPMRLTNGTGFSQAMALGRGDVSLTERTGKAIALEAKTIGIRWNLAPVCDINSNPENPIINIRSYGETREIVSQHSVAYMEGTQSEFVLACAKHFPGHGDTAKDSHLTLPILNKSSKELQNLELSPFVEQIESGVKSIMIAHLSVPALDESGTPASLSSKIITDLLRNEMNFKGLIVTDALDMKAISDNYPAGSSAIKCIDAGVNVALIPENPFEAIEALSTAANSNPDLRIKLIESVKLIIEAKRWCGAMNRLPEMDPEKSLYYPEHEKLALKSALIAVEVQGEDILPIRPDQNFAVFAVMQTEDIEPATKFFSILTNAVDNDCDFGYIDSSLSDEDIEMLQSGIADAEMVILAYFYRARAYKGSIGISSEFKNKISILTAGKPVISILFGNPYLINELESDTFISTYSDSLPALAAAVLKLTGKTIPF